MSDPSIYRRLEALERAVALRQDRTSVTIATYTPSYFGATTAGVTTYSFQGGKYFLCNSFVIVSGYLSWSAATGTGFAYISLPFAVPSGQQYFVAASVWGIIATTRANLQCITEQGSSSLRITSTDSLGNYTQEPVRGTGQIIFSVAYPTA